MNLSFGSLELNRTHAAHIGTSPAGSIQKLNGAFGQEGVRQAEKKGAFESYLLEAVNELNSSQLAVSAVQEQVVTDPDSVDIHDVTTAMAKARMSLNLAQTVIDRLVKGWTDLSQNR